MKTQKSLATASIVLAFLALCIPGNASTLPAKKKPSIMRHALVKTLSVPAKSTKFVVTHPLQSLKDVLGVAPFVAENVVDVVHAGFDGLDMATKNQEYFGAIHLVFHGGNVLVGKADTGLESVLDDIYGRHE